MIVVQFFIFIPLFSINPVAATKIFIGVSELLNHSHYERLTRLLPIPDEYYPQTTQCHPTIFFVPRKTGKQFCIGSIDNEIPLSFDFAIPNQLFCITFQNFTRWVSKSDVLLPVSPFSKTPVL